MTEQDFGQFSAVMAALCEYYGKPKLSDMAVGLYFGALLEYPLADVQQGLTAHINNPDSGQFFPKAADVIRALEGSSETRASGAWAKVRHAIERVGHMPSVVFDDAVIHAVVADMGGWVQLSLVTYDELPFRERDFLRFYRSYIWGITHASWPVWRKPKTPPPVMLSPSRSSWGMRRGALR